MARLHGQADAWTPPPDFVRIRWDHQTFFEDVMIYGDTSAADCWALSAGGGTCPLRVGGGPDGDIMPRVGDTGSSMPTCTSATRCSSTAMSS